MKLEDLVVLLPCHSLEDLALERPPEEADELFSAWSGMFHPWLLAAAGKLPGWFSADAPPPQLSGRLVVVPPCCEARLPGDWLARAETEGAVVVRQCTSRRSIMARVFEELGQPAMMPEELVADFHALGLCHLLVELMTRQLRYMSNLDEVSFQRHAVSAAQALLAGDQEKCRIDLQNAFDLLSEAREYFYPVEARLLDLTLVAPSTLGDPLARLLRSGHPVNLLISGEVLEQLAQTEPETLAALREALQAGRAAIAGGEYSEGCLTLLPAGAIVRQLRQGVAIYQKHLGQRPSVFGRRQFGLSPLLPQLLVKTGFSRLLHFALDQGRFPTGNQSKIRLRGADGTEIDSLGRIPLDAGRSSSFLLLPEKLGDSMDLDHAATAVLAHWPGLASPWYDDLQRVTRRTSALGRFETLNEYFTQTEHTGQTMQHQAHQYRSPYLRRAVADGWTDPLSRWVRYYRHWATVELLRAATAMLACAGGKASADWQQQIERLAECLGPDGTVRQEGGESPQPGSADPSAPAGTRQASGGGDVPAECNLGENLLGQVAARLSEVLAASGPSSGSGYLLLNPWSFAQTLVADVPGLDRLPNQGGPVKAAGQLAESKQVAVEVPGGGFAWLGPGGVEGPAAHKPGGLWSRVKNLALASRSKKTPPAIAEENLLRNEYFEVMINPTTGSIHAVRDYVTHRSRIAQQVAFRYPGQATGTGGFAEDDPEKDYTIMAADEVAITRNGPVVGQIVSRGRLVRRDGELAARFVQQTTVRRASRVIELEIEIHPVLLPEPRPWRSYYAARFAWDDATAEVYRSLGLTAQRHEGLQMESPCYVDIRTEHQRQTILTEGLPVHRYYAVRKLDTLLIVHGERARRFRLGIGLDLPHPAAAALAFLAPQPLVIPCDAPPRMPLGWLFHLGARSVIALSWEPTVHHGHTTGFRVELQETEGRQCSVVLRACRRLATACKTDFLGENRTELAVQDDAVRLAMGAFEHLRMEVEFARMA